MDYLTGLWNSFTSAVGGLWDTVVGNSTSSDTSAPTDTSVSSGIVGSAVSNFMGSSSKSVDLNSPFSLPAPTVGSGVTDTSNMSAPSMTGTATGTDTKSSLLDFMGKNGAAVLLLGGMKMVGDSANLNEAKRQANVKADQTQQQLDLQKQQQQFTQKNSFVPTINVNPVTPNMSPFLPGGKTYNPVAVNTGIVGSGMQP